MTKKEIKKLDELRNYLSTTQKHACKMMKFERERMEENPEYRQYYTLWRSEFATATDVIEKVNKLFNN